MSAVVALVVSAGGAEAAGCKKVSGKMSIVPVTASCASAVGICATTTYSGGFVGQGSFVGTALLQTADTPTTSAVLLTGDQAIATKTGRLLTKDAIVLRLSGAGEFAEVDTVVGGTAEWLGSTGTLRAQGTFNPTTGGGGDYVGEFCLP